MADIVRYIAEQVPLKKAGSSWKGLCPFHTDTTPSFSVRPNPPLFHCFGCGARGDIFRFAMLRHGVPFPEAVAIVARHAGASVPDRGRLSCGAQGEVLEALEAAAKHFNANLWGPSGWAAREYLLGRGFARDTLERVRAGCATNEWDGVLRALGRKCSTETLVSAGLVAQTRGRTFDRFRSRVILPILDESGTVVGFAGRALGGSQPKYLNSEASAHFQKGRLLYGASWTRDGLARSGMALVMEGYFDVIRAMQAGIDTAVATCGSLLTTAQACWLARHVTAVVLSFDRDPAGEKATRHGIEMLLGQVRDVGVVELPRGDDPDSFIRRHGGEEFRQRLEGAVDGMEWLFDRIALGLDLAEGAGRVGYMAAALPTLTRLVDPQAQAYWLERMLARMQLLDDPSLTGKPTS